MMFADKLIRLRKKAGWSQEELAARLHVSRQAVSKWEGAQSVPDLEKIVRLSELFGVSTDYLLKDEVGAEAFLAGEDGSTDGRSDRRRCLSLHRFSDRADVAGSYERKRCLWHQ